MDCGYGECCFKNKDYVTKLHDSILHFHEQRYEIGCFVVMANHCHLAMRPFDGFDLEKEIGAIKRAASRFINEREGQSGPLWREESYDRIIRDEEHLYRVLQYVGRNPAKAKLPMDQWYRWLNPNWKDVGWNFEELNL